MINLTVSAIPVSYTELIGKKWIFVQSSMILQCAYCIHVQQLMPVRDGTGLVVSLEMTEPESHSNNCPQRNEETT